MYQDLASVQQIWAHYDPIFFQGLFGTYDTREELCAKHSPFTFPDISKYQIFMFLPNFTLIHNFNFPLRSILLLYTCTFVWFSFVSVCFQTFAWYSFSTFWVFVNLRCENCIINSDGIRILRAGNWARYLGISEAALFKCFPFLIGIQQLDLCYIEIFSNSFI